MGRELGRRARRPAPAGPLGSRLDLGRERGVGGGGRQGEVAGAAVGVGDHVGQAAVQGLAVERVGAGQHHRGQQRVGHPHEQVVAHGQQVVAHRGG